MLPIRLRRVLMLLAAIAACFAPGACGDDDDPGDDVGTSADVVVVEVEIGDGRVDTAEDRVEVASGSTVRLVVTSDVDDELHVHGVDETAALVAGVPTTLEFTVDEPGVYEVETHGDHTLLFQLLVR